MRRKRYFLLAIILLVILGIFLTLGILNSRRIMMDLIKEEARSFLTIVASTQENSIFAEGEFEDAIIEKLINVCDYLETISLNRATLEKIRQHFDFNSMIVFDAKTQQTIATSGNPFDTDEDIFTREEALFFNYFTIANKKFIRFIYDTQKRVYQIEVSAEEIGAFRQEFGIKKITNQLSANPMVKYLVLQDRKGILFATPNVYTITRIDDDSTLIDVLEQNVEASRIGEFENEDILELIRPFVVEGERLGLWRIGISLENYHRHVRATENQLILLFVILFGAGFVLFFLFMKYQSVIGLKDLFDTTLGAVEDAVLTVNAKGTITGINKMFASMSAFEEKMLVDHSYFTLFGDDPFEVQKVLKEGSKIVDEKVIFNKNIQYATYPLLDDKNRIAGTISVLRDVTKLREFETEREETERLKFLGNLVANFAHEIKNPLNGLSIAVQRLMKEFPSGDEEYNHLASSIKKEIESLNKILNDFLSLARPRIKEKKEFDLSALIHDTLSFVKEQASRRKVEIREDISEEIKVIGAPDDFKRAILNIVLNALSAVADNTGVIDVQLKKRKSDILLTIVDNGVGMDKEEIERIFTPYFTTKKGGTGLGLYIAQRILKEHQADIKVTSKRGKGTTFKILLKSE